MKVGYFLTQKVILIGKIVSIDLVNRVKNSNRYKAAYVILKEDSLKNNKIPIFFNSTANVLIKSIRVGDILEVHCKIHDVNNRLRLDAISTRILQTSMNNKNNTIRDVRVKVLNGIFGKRDRI